MTKKTIAIDFDGVLAEYDQWVSAEHYGKPHPDAMFNLRRYIEAGYDVVIFTTRGETREGRLGVKNWLTRYGLQEKYVEAIKVTNQKVPALFYLDDRAWRFEGRFPEVSEIENHKVWYKGGHCEDQTTIGLWVHATFPNLGKNERKHRVIRILEEAIELAFAEGFELGDIADAVGAAMNYCEKQEERGDPAEESGDLLIALLAYGFKAKIDVVDEKEKKMRKNRSRPKSYYDMKSQMKKDAGLWPKEAQ